MLQEMLQLGPRRVFRRAQQTRYRECTGCVCIRATKYQNSEVLMRRFSSRIHRFSIAFHVAAIFSCAGAYAQILVHFDLPAQPLAKSLRAIGTATNTDIGFSSSQVAGIQAPALKADLTVNGALARVLAGTGLQPLYVDNHTIVLTIEGPSSTNPRQKSADSARCDQSARNS